MRRRLQLLLLLLLPQQHRLHVRPLRHHPCCCYWEEGSLPSSPSAAAAAVTVACWRCCCQRSDHRLQPMLDAPAPVLRPSWQRRGRPACVHPSCLVLHPGCQPVEPPAPPPCVAAWPARPASPSPSGGVPGSAIPDGKSRPCGNRPGGGRRRYAEAVSRGKVHASRACRA